MLETELVKYDSMGILKKLERISLRNHTSNLNGEDFTVNDGHMPLICELFRNGYTTY